MKFLALLAIFAVVAAVSCNKVAQDPRCPQDESTESQATYFAHESDCSKYYTCANGDSIEMQCPKVTEESHLHWNAVENVCDWPETANCQL